MSYITEMTIGGKLRSLRFNNYGREAVARLYGVDPLEISENMKKTWEDSFLTMATDVIYWGLVGDYRALRKPIDFTIADVSMWMENVSNDEIAEPIKVFLASESKRILNGMENAESLKNENIPGDNSAVKKN